MHIYSFPQWVLLFFFYCFCGWVWECCYVSARQRTWVNRGFLEGPILPIYGSGAILILFVTMPVERNLLLVYILGCAAATALEYVTGAAMESIFKVRYWDYSNQRFQLHGHICLTSSIAWGFFSILLVRFIHPPIGRLLARVPDILIEPLAFVLTVLATVDAVRSVQDALDLRETLLRLTEENEDLRRLARRAEITAAFVGDDLQRFRQRTEVDKLILETYLTSRRQAVKGRSQRRRELLEEAVHQRLSAKLQALENIADVLERSRDSAQDTAELHDLLRRVRDRQSAIRQRTTRVYHKTARILRRNPSAVSKDLQEAMEILRALDGRRD